MHLNSIKVKVPFVVKKELINIGSMVFLHYLLFR